MVAMKKSSNVVEEGTVLKRPNRKGSIFEIRWSRECLWLCRHVRPIFEIPESQVNEKTQELKRNDDKITQEEKIIRDKSDSISSLHSEVTSFQDGILLSDEPMGWKGYARSGELEKQATIEAQQKEKEALEARANEADKKIKELGSTIEKILENYVEYSVNEVKN
ncbi:hypothetical protein FNV43_RR05341 [Rhamnella rubrinervis]|uniref:Uncharacterized protein n=1 Tax=Rhamnella rubrinervis TaxID=2594499 RepID=A0A8K0HMS0_9ROSA|nr:hypothetical protein FNV43_RR05341 [Rhamnella rubrinervis]